MTVYRLPFEQFYDAYWGRAEIRDPGRDESLAELERYAPGRLHAVENVSNTHIAFWREGGPALAKKDLVLFGPEGIIKLSTPDELCLSVEQEGALLASVADLFEWEGWSGEDRPRLDVQLLYREDGPDEPTAIEVYAPLPRGHAISEGKLAQVEMGLAGLLKAVLFEAKGGGEWAG